MEPRRSDTQLQVTKGFHLEKNQPRTGQGVKKHVGLEMSRGALDSMGGMQIYQRDEKEFF